MAFDPYHKWLAIHPKDQPPNHYRLLGLELFESDLEVTEGAADRAMGFIRQYQSGEHASLAAKLLNEIAAARLCLLKPKSKAEYDTKLKQEFAQKVAANPETATVEFETDAPITAKRASRVTKRKPAKAKSSQQIWIAAGIGGGICVLLLAFFLIPRGTVPAKIESISRSDTESLAPTNSSSQTKMPAQQRPTPTSKTEKTTPTVAHGAVPATSGAPKTVVRAIGPKVDLIQAVDIARDTVSGSWSKQGTSLIAGVGSWLYLPARLPDDYQIRLNATRIVDNDTLFVGFVMTGRQGVIVIDGWDSTNSGMYVDGCEPNNNCTTRQGAVLQNSRASTIFLTVHPGHLNVEVDGKTIIDWYGQPERVYSPSPASAVNRETAILATARAQYRFESIEMVPIEPESKPAQPAKLDRWLDIVPLLDVKRDAK